MKHLCAVFLVLLLFPGLCFSQHQAPPVQQGGSGALKITPDPNKIPSSPAAKPQTARILSDYAITVIVDYSGSMKGEPITSAKNSTLTLIDLIEFWKRLYPNRIGNLQFQFIQFGGAKEHRILFPLGPIKDFTSLRNAITRSSAKYTGTDYNSGINLAIRELEKKKIKHNKTLLLTDGADHGKGPVPGELYDMLGEMIFILYGPDSVGKRSVKKWLDNIKYSSEIEVTSEYEVTTAFVASLFEYVDNINKYLVRRGKQKLDESVNFRLSKHSPEEECKLVVTRPNPDIDIVKIKNPGGKILPKSDYTLYKGNTFFQINLNKLIPAGNYEITFSGMNRSHSFKYISFELCKIYLNLFTIPKLAPGECFVENSVVNFEMKFWDNTMKEEIQYKNFLDYVAYRYVIENGIGSYIGTDPGGLRFKKSLTVGSAGQYDVLTSWNYNVGKLKNDDPPLQMVGRVCIDPNGSLVQVDFDMDQTWEGRDIRFTAILMDPKGNILSDIKTIGLNTNHSIVTLKQLQPGENKYEGVLRNAKPGFYQLSIRNSDKNYKLAIDKNSLTQFPVEKRALIFSIEGLDFSSMDKNVGFWGKIGLGLKDIFGDTGAQKKIFEYKAAKDIAIPYRLPFSGYFDKEIRINIRPDKLFQDEKLTLHFEPTGDSVFLCPNVKDRWLWGLFQTSKSMKDAVEAVFLIKGGVTLSHGESIDQALHIRKKNGDMYFDKPLYREPGINTLGNIKISLPNEPERTLSLSPTLATFEITTDAPGMWMTEAIRWGKILLLLLIAVFALIAGLAFLLIRRQRFLSKFAIWEECQSRSPEDFFEDLPDKIKQKCTDDLEAGLYDGLFELHEANLKREIGKKRVFRKKLADPKSSSAFCKEIVKAFAKKKIEAFKSRVKSNEILELPWIFSMPAAGKTVFIKRMGTDEDEKTETNVRTRGGTANNYGEITIEPDGRPVFRNPEFVVFIKNNVTNRWERINYGSETELSNSTSVRFGPGPDEILFMAIIDFMPDQNRLNVTITREYGGF